MTEQQRTLKNDDLQRKWKLCIRNICYQFRLQACCKLIIQSWRGELSKALNSILEPFAEKLSKVFKDINSVTISNKRKSYPHGYPPYVHNMKVNKRGYPKPVTRCARSRCK